MNHLFYMAREPELKKHRGVVEMFQLIASTAKDENETRHVWNALWSFWNFEHAFDDILDAGHLTGAEKETLLIECAEYLKAVLLTPDAPAAALVFKAHYRAALAAARLDAETNALALQAFDDFTGNLLDNPFYRRHAPQHLAMFDMMILRTIAGDEMASSVDPARQALAPAVRCGDIDFIVHVAKLAGGWEAALKFSALRDYDKPDEILVETAPAGGMVAA